MECMKPLYAHFLTKPYGVAVAALTAAALIMTRIPLLGDLGFEFAMATAFVAAYANGFLAIFQFARLRTVPSPAGFFPVFWMLCLLTSSTLVPPLAVIGLKGLLTGLCNPLEGMAFYLLLPGITTLLAVALAMLCGLIAPRPRHAVMLFVGCTLVLLGIGIYRMVTQPPVFAYNPVIGYFPGPIYDEIVRITPTLLAARAIDLLGVVAIVAGLHAGVEPQTWTLRPARLWGRYRWPEEAGRSAARLICIAACAGLAAAHAYRASLGIAIDRTHIQRTLGGHKQTEHFDIYYDVNAQTARHIDLIALDHEYQLARLTEFLRVPPPSARIRSYIYGSPEQKKHLMGAGDTSMERPGDDEMHLNDEPFPHPVMKHELAHVLSAAFGNRLYGGSYKMGLHEGLATAADWEEGRLTPHQWSRAMRQLDLAPPLERVLGTFGFWTEAPSRSYTLCGSFVRFLIDRHGIERFKRAFPDGDIEGIYRQPLPDLIRRWEAFIDSIRLSEEELRSARQYFQQPSIFERRCAHEVAALNNEATEAYRRQRYQAAIRLFEQADALQPNHPLTLRGLLYATYWAGAHDRTDSLAARILATPQQTVGLMAEAYLMQGDLAWKHDNVAQARERYRQALALHASERTDRDALVKLDTLGRPRIRTLVREYLLAEPEDGRKLVLVRDALHIDPDFGVGHYLIGRWLFQAEAYRYALPYLLRTRALLVSAPLLEEENLQAIALCYFYMKQYDKAEEAFRRMAETTAYSGKAVRAQEWMVRCRWFAARSGNNPVLP
jgi:tetratricopeptide (TPR) repeat protein